MMTKTELKSLTRDTLLSRARQLGLKALSSLRKDQLVDRIAETLAKSRGASEKKRQEVMDKKESPKRESLLKKIVGAPASEPSGPVNKPAAGGPKPTYARKPASNIQRRRTTLRKVQNIVTANREKRASKASRPEPVTPAPAPEPVQTPETFSPAAEMVAHKFDIPPHQTPAPVDASQFDNLGELPESYGTGTLFLVGRDPHWLFAYWDYTWHQMSEFRGRADDHTVRLRIYRVDGEHSQLQQDIVLQHDAKNWFIHVAQARTNFRAEIGYYSQGGFHVLTRSSTIKTPADDLSQDTYVRFATLPFHIKFQEIIEFVKAHYRPGDELMDVLYRLQARGFRLPFDYEGMDDWDTDKEGTLLQIFGDDLFRRIQMGSFEISEWLRKRFREEALAGITSWSSPSSPFGASWQKQYRGFWFNVNAEIILYGETDPRARVVVDGKEIKLRPDGSFRFHFALPDGQFCLPIAAESPDRQETRAATIDFSRATDLQGDVGQAKAGQNLPDPVKV